MNRRALPYTQSGVSTPPGKAAHADPTPIRLLDPTVFEAIADPGRYRPDHCPQCEAQQPLAGPGFYQRTLVDVAFDGVIRVRRYLCGLCKRTVSLLPECTLPGAKYCGA